VFGLALRFHCGDDFRLFLGQPDGLLYAPLQILDQPVLIQSGHCL